MAHKTGWKHRRHLLAFGGEDQTVQMRLSGEVCELNARKASCFECRFKVTRVMHFAGCVAQAVFEFNYFAVLVARFLPGEDIDDRQFSTSFE